ncbi:hypothetical protein AB4304_16280 [Vibrio breoganii]
MNKIRALSLALPVSLLIGANPVCAEADNWGYTTHDYAQFEGELKQFGTQPFLEQMQQELVNMLPLNVDSTTTLTRVTVSGERMRQYYWIDVDKAVEAMSSLGKEMTKEHFVHIIGNPFPFGYPAWCEGNPLLRLAIENGASLHAVIRDVNTGDVVYDGVLSTCL